MSRIEKIYQYIQQLPSGATASAQQVANALGIDRANASSDLNNLVKKKRLLKHGSRPVLFSCPAPNKETYIDSFTQKNPSLKAGLEQAKAAVLYPPRRMHILLSGETGVGKSMFAELIYTFSQEQKRISPHAKFITFNCADYASNPQLILGQLFGIIEGSYTGAVSSRKGLLEEADGGILFLDEIHRLPPEAQEMLFTFMDKKVYHALGETSFDKSADVQLICATTEEIHSSLLQTFTRRIPMKIYLPSLEERELSERLSLITTFLNEETNNLDRSIKLSMNSLRALLSYHCPSNIGQLKTDIQLLCAQGYARSFATKENELTITSYDLPKYIKEGLYSAEKRNDLWKLFPSHTSRFIKFQKNHENQFFFSENKNQDIYHLIDQKMADMEKIGLNTQATKTIVDMTIHDFFQSLEKHTAEHNKNIINLVGSEIFSTTKRFLAASAATINDYSESVISGLALHIYNLFQRIKNGQTIKNPRLKSIQLQYREYYKIAEKNKQMIEHDLAIQIPEDEIGFLTLFLAPQEADKSKNKVKVIVVAHGESTASSMAKVVNELLDNHNITAFNMPLSCQPKNMLMEIEAYLKQAQYKNVLILTDMGSLTNFADELQQRTSYSVKCVDLVSTLHVLEASRKARLGYSLDEIADDLRKISYTAKQESKTNRTKKTDKSFIITACTTGNGSAKLIKDLLLQQLNLYDNHTEIRSFQITDSEALEKELMNLRLEGEILCYISTFQIGYLACPYFNISQAFQPTSLNKIQQLVDFDFAASLATQNIAPLIQAVDGEILLKNIKNWIISVEYQLELTIPSEIKVGLLCHLASLIDYLKTNDSIEQAEKIAFENKKEKEAYNELRSLELIYGVTFSHENIEHIMAYIFQKKLCL